MFMVGDKVIVKSHPNKVTGVVTDTLLLLGSSLFGGSNDIVWYTVTFDDEELIPRSLNYVEDDLERFKQTDAKCTCGVQFTSSSKHSDWCDLYEEE